MSETRTPEERQQDRRDQIEMLLIREGLSLLVMVAVLALMSPKAQMWIGQQKQRFMRRRRAVQAHEALMLSLLRAELARDLPAVEHGLVDP
jgi:hypothetical protein